MKHPLLLATTLLLSQHIYANPVQDKLKNLEKNFNGKIGVYAINTNNNQTIANRADERFPLQSTMKLMGVAALLKSGNDLKQIIHYSKNDLVTWHPLSGKYVTTGATFETLSEAAISYSDNAAINIIMKKLGGPAYITEFAHSIGNKTFNIEHYEVNLNSNPASLQDTSTPKDMALSVQKLILGDILPPAQRTELLTWMRNSTTAYKRMRAGAPLGWSVADKTGSGDYGIANDIGILWSPLCKPIVLSIYTVRNKPDAEMQDDIVAKTTSIVLEEFAKQDPCFAKLTS